SRRAAAPVAAPVTAAAAADAQDIAIVGMACRLPGASDDPERFWALLRGAGEGVVDRPARYRRADDAAPLACGTLSQLEWFDAAFFGISPAEAALMDPMQRLALEVGWTALEDAGVRPDQLAGSATGVFLGVGLNEYYALSRDAATAATEAFLPTGNSP